MEKEKIIAVANLSKKFGKLDVLKNVNVSCSKQQCIALIGPNGCGKTTLIKSVLGMVLPDDGSIKFNGKSVLGEYLHREKSLRYKDWRVCLNYQ